MNGLPENQDQCWNRIGVAGDGSCPELKTHVHCRNCPVYRSAASAFFDREPPRGYLESWTAALANPEEGIDRDRAIIAIFRLHDEWLGLNISSLVEVTTPKPVHRIPHRGNNVLLGLVNVRGQLRLFVSLHGLLGIDLPNPWWREASDATTTGNKGRFIVYQAGAESWVFPADEAAGVFRISRAKMKSVGAGRSGSGHGFAQAVFRPPHESWKDRTVNYLDDQRVGQALRELGT
jgi:chemotaxis-related protein WspD